MEVCKLSGNNILINLQLNYKFLFFYFIFKVMKFQKMIFIKYIKQFNY
jgi:hypothetical protein